MFRTKTTKLAGVAVVVCAFVVAPQAFATMKEDAVFASERRVPGSIRRSRQRLPPTGHRCRPRTSVRPTRRMRLLRPARSIRRSRQRFLHRTSVPASDKRSPDTQDAAARPARSIRRSRQLFLHRTSVSASDKRSPDTRDAVARSTGLDPASAAAITSHRAAVTASDMRSPDTLDAVAQSGRLDPSSAAAITSHRAAVTATGHAFA